MLTLKENILRFANFAFLAICLGILASLLATQKGHDVSPYLRYCTYASCFGIFTDGLYGLFANFRFAPYVYPIFIVIFDFLGFSFSFAAGTALAVGIKTHTCSASAVEARDNEIILGSVQRCRKSQATVAFFYFSTFIFLAKFVLSIFSLRTHGPRGFPSGKPPRRLFRKQKKEMVQKEREEKNPEEHEYQSDNHSSMA
ncbi:hypothetical protein BZL39_I00590 [Zygosaccharomyces parabailii]|nr:hypothetical protein BZL39_I00590 [Zygosaccharomyces parabailii]CDH11724.1 related to Non-classical export protein 2 [Zygosaccharomyces bailii ISA1307]